MHYVALLRGINLGKRRIKMDDLRRHFAALKFRDVFTFIASGNVLFASSTRSSANLESQIERHLAKTLGYNVDTFIRTRAELAAAAAAEPFPQIDLASETHTIYVGFWKTPLDADRERRFARIRTDADEVRVIGREFYWLCRIKSNESKLWTLPELRALKLPTATLRNLKALRRMTAEYPPVG